MSEVRDPAIKLFGRTIPVQERRAMLQNYAPEVIVEAGDGSGGGGEQVFHCDGPPVEKDFGSEEKGNDLEVVCIEEPGQTCSSSSLNDHKVEDNPETNTQEDNNAVEESKPSTTIEEEQAEAENGNDKVLKKPDKILPCPRCNSLDTKFCYYNNYNVNQPRHFCKNCQRYWTAGGTMRNVPVGAGRRKNKHSASHYRAIMISEGMAASRVDNIESNHHQVIPFSIPASRPLKPNGTVLKFGSESPLCESMASVLNLGDQAADKRNLEMNAVACAENGEEVSCGSSVTSSACVENEIREDVGKLDQAPIGGNNCCKGPVPPQLQCYAGAPWPYHWNPAWNNVAAMAGRCSSELVYKPENGGSHILPWSSPPMVAAPAFCGPTVPFHIVPASYWGCMAGWPGGAWNVPWVGSGAVSPVSSTSSSVCSGNGSPTLGKHSRDPSIPNEEKPEKCVWVPKTLRIDDPDEAARSSIWATLGIKPEGGEPLARGGMFKAFQPKKDSSNIIHIPEASAVLHANPAALSRSQAFQESA